MSRDGGGRGGGRGGGGRGDQRCVTDQRDRRLHTAIECFARAAWTTWVVLVLDGGGGGSGCGGGGCPRHADVFLIIGHVAGCCPWPELKHSFDVVMLAQIPAWLARCPQRFLHDG